MKKIVVTVTNDLSTDQRVKRSIGVLKELDFDICLVGRILPDSMPIDRSYETVRFKLWFRKGFLFYANYNIRIFFFLLFRKFDLYFSNDLDTLLPNYLMARLKRKPIIYDSHEYFTGVPEIQDRTLVKKVWAIIERFAFLNLEKIITVNNSISRLYKQKYHKELLVVRNVSDSSLPQKILSRTELNLPQDAFIMINQGAGINVGRGMEEALQTLKLLEEKVILLIVGGGDVLATLKKMVKWQHLSHRVIFIPKRPYQQMLQYTLNADCGLSLDKPGNLNYKYSLPNKVFDYIKCGIPLVVSEITEVRSIVEKYKVGEVVKNYRPEAIAKAIKTVMNKGKLSYRDPLKVAATENSWEKERKKLKDFLKPLA